MCGFGVAVFKRLEGFFNNKSFTVFKGFLGCLLAARELANGRLGCPEEAIEALLAARLAIMGFKGLEGLRAGKRQTWTPIRRH